jgi:flavin-dependent dehydrogenase
MTTFEGKTQVDFDVAVIGGALSGAASALLLKREDPSLRVVVIEKNDSFDDVINDINSENIIDNLEAFEWMAKKSRSMAFITTLSKYCSPQYSH